MCIYIYICIYLFFCSDGFFVWIVCTIAGFCFVYHGVFRCISLYGIVRYCIVFYRVVLQMCCIVLHSIASLGFALYCIALRAALFLDMGVTYYLLRVTYCLFPTAYCHLTALYKIDIKTKNPESGRHGIFGKELYPTYIYIYIYINMNIYIFIYADKAN